MLLAALVGCEGAPIIFRSVPRGRSRLPASTHHIYVAPPKEREVVEVEYHRDPITGNVVKTVTTTTIEDHYPYEEED